MSRPMDDRLLDLLVSRATEGLAAPESDELGALLAGMDRPVDEEIEMAAAAADLAWMHEHRAMEAMPPEVRRRLSAQARTFAESMDTSAPREREPVAAAPPADRPSRPAVLPAWSGWLAAAAALVLLVVSVVGDGDTVAPGPDLPPPADPVAQRQALLVRPDTLQVAWATPEAEAYRDVSGDVVWNNATQTGFMRLTGLPSNSPQREQYQLWIVDPTRDEHPVDGGVFDIPPGTDEVVIPIRAKLLVAEPKAFAITLEQPGGVVVSDGPLLVVAPVEG